MQVFIYFLLVLYFSALLYIGVYCLMQLHLLFLYKKHQWTTNEKDAKPLSANDELPFVTIQLPIYNELYVVERLIDVIAKFDYPKDKYEIQVLDDSTDETVSIIANKVLEYKAKGFDIHHLTRTDRTGYKAGALKEGLKTAKGEFVAIFDADFMPRPGFLKGTLKHFEDPKVGVVQTRWEHLNEDYSLLTRLQAMQLNVHFTVEQKGRYVGNCLLQFNGTAGIWRNTTIESAGGWEADTLTEDLDLSYRAQLKGWKIIFLEDLGSPAELPSEINGLKSQQFRWTKGGAETARKMLPTVLKAPISLRKKVHALVHLSSSIVFVFILMAGVSSVPLLFLLERISFDTSILSLFLTSLFAMVLVYYVANVENDRRDKSWFKKIIKFILLFPIFLALSMGLSLHNSIAVIQGYLGKKSPFIRTPKFDILNMSDTFRKKKYHINKLDWVTIFEGVLTLYFFIGLVSGIYLQNDTFTGFHLMLSFGFGTIFYYSILHLDRR